MWSKNAHASPPLPGKKGIGLTLRAEGEKGCGKENIPKLKQLHVAWNYSWSVGRHEHQPTDIEFVPMVWGCSNTKKLQQNLHLHLHPQKGTALRVLAFNEPDCDKQSNMSVEEALDSIKFLHESNLSVVSPSTVNAQGEWMQEFVKGAELRNIRIDWIGVHWYGGPNFESFKNYMTKVHTLYNRPILITEFAPADWTAKHVHENKHAPSQVLKFMKQALPWLEETEWIAGYAWFPFNISSAHGTKSALFNDKGNLTTLGQFYASVRPGNPNGDQSIGEK